MRAQLQAGHTEEAARTAAGIREAAAGRRLATAVADRAAAAVALAAGDAGAAAEHALAAAAACDEVGAPVEAALARLLAGRAISDREAAIAELERAAAVFDARGALRHRDEAERELRALGRRVYRRSAPGAGAGLESLTERELEVARLVVDRRTNSEIAAELFLFESGRDPPAQHLRQARRRLSRGSSRAPPSAPAARAPLRDDDVVDPRRGGALGDEVGEERERLARAGRLDGPPDLVAARAARRRSRLTAQGAGVPAEGGERGAAVERLVTVVEEEARYGRQCAAAGGVRHRCATLIFVLAAP